MVKQKETVYVAWVDDCPTAIQVQFQKQMDAFEQANWRSSFQFLVESGMVLPPPDMLAEAALHAKLWEVIHALALMENYLEHTDHLSDRELYRLLWDDVLREETVMDATTADLICHIDLVGSGSEVDNQLYLKYYADEEARIQWLEVFPNESMPHQEPCPFDRDRQLPKPDRTKQHRVH